MYRSKGNENKQLTCSKTDLFTVRLNRCNLPKSMKVFDLFSNSPKGESTF